MSFNTIEASLNDLFSFSMIADKGVDIRNAYKVNVAGDIYAASDFYNKDYNGTTNKTIGDSTSKQQKKLKNIKLRFLPKKITMQTECRKQACIPAFI